MIPRGAVITAVLLLAGLVVPALATSAILALEKRGPAPPVAGARVKPRGPATTGEPSAAYDSAYDDAQRPAAVSRHDPPKALPPREPSGDAARDGSTPLIGRRSDSHHPRSIPSNGSRAPPASRLAEGSI
jgi:hypothetical protein